MASLPIIDNAPRREAILLRVSEVIDQGRPVGIVSSHHLLRYGLN